MLATAALVAGASHALPALAQMPGVIIDKSRQPGVGEAMQPGIATPSEPFEPESPLPGETAPPRETDGVAPPRDQGDIIAPGDIIEFSADSITFDDNSGVVTAAGQVSLNRDAWRLSADSIEYNRKTGVVTAIGNVVATDPQGNQSFGDEIVLSDSLRNGVIRNILLVLNDGGRVAAVEGERSDRIINLRRAVYSPCAVVDDLGCPHSPVWQVKALRITYNRDKHRLFYRDASLEMFGVPVLYLPAFSHPDGEAKRASGLLLPVIDYQQQLGLGLGLPYYLQFGSDKDLTITPRFYTSVNPALQLSGRKLFRNGPVQVDAFFTYGELQEFGPDGETVVVSGNKFRGYFGLKGRLQHNKYWQSAFSIRRTTDDTFNRTYALDFDDTLRSTYAITRLDNNSWFSASAWAFQGLRVTDEFERIPFALPLIDYDWRSPDPVLGGQLQLAINNLTLFRPDGQNMQRLLGLGRWDRSFLTPLGQRITATAFLRGDLYYAWNQELEPVPEYAGQNGFHGRIIPLAAVDVEWPFAGPALGGIQTITPRAQLIALPTGLNQDIPNEDSRAVELEDISLFDLNRFPGYDRFEGGMRFTYGVQYALARPNVAFRTEVGQSLRLTGDGSEFPVGTGVNEAFSDWVGRSTLKLGTFFDITHRFRLDAKNFAFRRNEIDFTVGTRRNYVVVGYSSLNRNIQLEDLEDRAEVRVGARVAFAQFWSAFGSAIVDVTPAGISSDPESDGFRPIRHRVGIEYEDECFRIGVAWRRDYVADRDFRAGNTYLLTLAFKSLSR
jgi:LPS-assembly protein